MSSLLCGEFDRSLGDETAHYSAHGVVVRFVVLGSCEHVTRAQGARVRRERVEWILRLGFVCEGSVSVVIPSCFVSCRLCVCIMRVEYTYLRCRHRRSDRGNRVVEGNRLRGIRLGSMGSTVSSRYRSYL